MRVLGGVNHRAHALVEGAALLLQIDDVELVPVATTTSKSDRLTQTGRTTEHDASSGARRRGHAGKRPNEASGVT